MKIDSFFDRNSWPWLKVKLESRRKISFSNKVLNIELAVNFRKILFYMSDPH